MVNQDTLTQMARALEVAIKQGELNKPFDSNEIAEIVINHAAACAIAAMASGVLPGVGSLVATGIAIGAIWRMYVRIAEVLKLKLGTDTLKAIASAVVANIVTQFAGLFVLDLAFSFIPGAGVLLAGAVTFGVTYLAGVIYLKMLTGIFNAGEKPESMSAQELQNQMKQATQSVDAKNVFEEGKSAFKTMNKDGSLKDAGAGIDIEECEPVR